MAIRMWNVVKTAIFTIVVPGTVGVYMPYRLGEPRVHPVSAIAWLGWAPIVIGAAIYFWCAWDFATVGRGTPLPADAPKRLVARGLYRYVRNPMYVGVMLVILGQAMWFESEVVLWYATAVAICFNAFVLLYEEPTLRRKFGESYACYCRTVPRWLPKRAAKPAPVK